MALEDLGLEVRILSKLIYNRLNQTTMEVESLTIHQYWILSYLTDKLSVLRRMKCSGQCNLCKVFWLGTKISRYQQDWRRRFYEQAWNGKSSRDTF